jgi:hypothetical protein
MKFSFLSSKQKDEKQEKSILFVCMENAGHNTLATEPVQQDISNARVQLASQ